MKRTIVFGFTKFPIMSNGLSHPISQAMLRGDKSLHPFKNSLYHPLKILLLGKRFWVKSQPLLAYWVHILVFSNQKKKTQQILGLGLLPNFVPNLLSLPLLEFLSSLTFFSFNFAIIQPNWVFIFYFSFFLCFLLCRSINCCMPPTPHDHSMYIHMKMDPTHDFLATCA